jgi:hypothetical protein
MADARLHYNGGFDRKDPMVFSPVYLVALAPLAAWRVMSRIRRLTTRQRSKTWRHRTTLVFFPLLLTLLAWLAATTNPVALAGMAAGLIAGAVVGFIAIRKTRFEQVGDAFYFTPYAPIGKAMAALLFARMGWRAFEWIVLDAADHRAFVASTPTMLVFGILAGYYISFALGLLAWRKRTSNSLTQAA